MLGMASFIKKVYKLKRDETDGVPKIEGKTCTNWMCLDLGNIALHIFSEKARAHYSLETLWTMGEEYENRTRKQETVEDIYEEFLNIAETQEKIQKIIF